MKYRLLLTMLTMLMGLTWLTGLMAQPSPQASTIPFSTPAPSSPASIGASVVGPTGATQYCYWVVANYPIGKSSITGPAIVKNGPLTLTGSNYIQIGWSATPGATSYDLLRTPVATKPTGTANIAVAINIPGTTRNDVGGALASYTPTSAPGATGYITLDNMNFLRPTLRISPDILATLSPNMAVDWIMNVSDKPFVDAREYGTKGDGVTDDSAAIQAAIYSIAPNVVPVSIYPTGTLPPTVGGTVYLTRGRYRLDHPIYLPSSVNLMGAGVIPTVFLVPTTFPLASDGVIIQSNNLNIQFTGWANVLSGFSVVFSQPDTVAIGDKIHYPAAIRQIGPALAKSLYTNMRIVAAWIGIQHDTVGSDGFTADHVEISNFYAAFLLDVILDRVFITNSSVWAYGLTANQLTCMENNAYGAIIRRVDDLHISNTLFFVFVGLWAPGDGGSGGTFGNLSNVSFDSFNGIRMEGASGSTLGCSPCYFSQTAIAGLQAIKITGVNNRLRVGNSFFGRGGDYAASVVEISGNANGSYLQIVNSRFEVLGDTTIVSATTTVGNVFVQLTGNTISKTAGVALARPFIDIGTSALLEATGNWFSKKIGGSGVAINLQQALEHHISGNAMYGWNINKHEGDVFSYVCNNSYMDSTISDQDNCGRIPVWHNYRITKIANGVNGCATANGCWQVNRDTPVAAAAALTQTLNVITLPGYGYIDNLRIKSVVACTGAATTRVTDFGLTGTVGYYIAGMTYDLKAAVSNTNLLNPILTALGSNTAVAINATLTITNTVNNIDQIANGCSVDAMVKWGISQ